MTESDRRESTDIGQEKFVELLRAMKGLMPRPPIRPDEVYPRKEAAWVARVSPTTLKSWMKSGLKSLKKRKRIYIRGKDLIEFLESEDKE